MEHADQAVSREELLNAVWGYETAVETRATDDTVRRLRQKLEGLLGQVGEVCRRDIQVR